MKAHRRFTLATALLALILMVQITPALAAPSLDSSAFEKVMQQAVAGDSGRLAQMLDKSTDGTVQRQLAQWLVKRGDLDASALNLSTTPLSAKAPVANASSLPAVSTCGGYYNCTCQAYNGVYMGWYGKIILACHGWYDAYISGRHVVHMNPDLIPRGYPVSGGCAYAIGTSLLSVASIGTIGWAAYGVGLIVNAGGVVISCP